MVSFLGDHTSESRRASVNGWLQLIHGRQFDKIQQGGQQDGRSKSCDETLAIDGIACRREDNKRREELVTSYGAKRSAWSTCMRMSKRAATRFLFHIPFFAREPSAIVRAREREC